MRRLWLLFPALVFIQLAGCAAHSEPIIDMQGVDEDQFNQDWRPEPSAATRRTFGRGRPMAGYTAAHDLDWMPTGKASRSSNAVCVGAATGF
jgi:hypothetical protein